MKRFRKWFIDRASLIDNKFVPFQFSNCSIPKKSIYIMLEFYSFGMICGWCLWYIGIWSKNQRKEERWEKKNLKQNIMFNNPINELIDNNSNGWPSPVSPSEPHIHIYLLLFQLNFIQSQNNATEHYYLLLLCYVHGNCDTICSSQFTTITWFDWKFRSESTFFSHKKDYIHRNSKSKTTRNHWISLNR